MSHESVAAHSPWVEFALPKHAALDRDIEVDVVVVGGGLTGITAAYLLRQDGVRVALIERDRVASADTGRTTAHLTYVTDSRLRDLSREWGKEAAKSFGKPAQPRSMRSPGSCAKRKWTVISNGRRISAPITQRL